MDDLKRYAEAFGIELSPAQSESFSRYYEMLIEKNKVMNLTAITEKEEVIIKHFVDSMALVRYLPELSEKPLKVIDIGTGAGFPGIPLKIAFPKLDITLLDSLNKRILFLDEVISELGLSDIRTIHGRAEDFSVSSVKKSKSGAAATLRETFDLAVSRAVANLSSLSEYCLPYVSPGGLFISYKSGDIDAELDNARNAIRILGGKTERVEKLILPETDIARSFVFIRKINHTPKTYPRKAGTASKNPL